MKTNSAPEWEDSLLDATLRDEEWQAASAALKAQAVRTFVVRQRVRRRSRWVAAVAALAGLVAVSSFWGGRTVTTAHKIGTVQVSVPRASPHTRELTDAELVAAFPKDTCFIAEVDGKKELVFLSMDLKHTYMAAPVRQGN